RRRSADVAARSGSGSAARACEWSRRPAPRHGGGTRASASPRRAPRARRRSRRGARSSRSPLPHLTAPPPPPPHPPPHPLPPAPPQPPPALRDHAGRPVARFARDEDAVEPAAILPAVHQQRLAVWDEGLEDGVRLHPRLPRLEWQLGFGGARRARVEGHHAAERGIDEEEGDADRDLERVPLRVLEGERRRVAVAVRDGAELALRGALAGEEQVARPAGAEEVAALDVHHVRVLVRNGRRAHVAAFAGNRPARPVEHAAEDVDGAGGRRLILGPALLLAHAAAPPSATSTPVSRSSSGIGERCRSSLPSDRPAWRTS